MSVEVICAQIRCSNRLEGTFEHRCADGVTHGRQPGGRSRPLQSHTRHFRPPPPNFVVHRSPDDLPAVHTGVAPNLSSTGHRTTRPAKFTGSAPGTQVGARGTGRGTHRRPCPAPSPASSPPATSTSETLPGAAGAQRVQDQHDADSSTASSTRTPTVPRPPGEVGALSPRDGPDLSPRSTPTCTLFVQNVSEHAESSPVPVRDRHGRAQPHDPVQGQVGCPPGQASRTRCRSGFTPTPALQAADILYDTDRPCRPAIIISS